VTYYQDSDSDTYGNASVSQQAQGGAPVGYVVDNTDCDDTDNTIYPGATEIADDGIDQNCNGYDLATYYQDSDNDTYGNVSVTQQAEGGAPVGYVVDNTDCDDTDNTIYPGATEIADDGIDQDCDGSDLVTYYQDSDSDTYGNASVSQQAQGGAPVGYVVDDTDCDDTDNTIYPGATETCGDGIDQDCSGGDEACVLDCKSCHNTGQGTRRNIMTDFTYSFTHGDPWANKTNDDCELCHDVTAHEGGTVQLKEYGTANTHDYVSATPNTINVVCLSCHDGTGSAFSTGGAPVDVSTRWGNTTTVDFNKYADGGASFPNTVPVITKSYSPHALPGNNQAKDESTPDQGGTTAIGCVECHSAHGSTLGSGVNATMGTGDKMLNSNGGTYTKEEDLCWGCHSAAMDYYGEGNGTNWEGFWDNSIASYKAGNFVSSHFYPSKNNTWSGGSPPGSPTRSNVYCSSCHINHGISSSDTNHAYRVPILRDTWLTSPYKEDRAPGSVVDTSYNSSSNNFGPLPRVSADKDQSNVAPGGGYSGSSTSGWDGYFIDQNTFGTGTYIDETENQFAGLCLNCHPQASIMVLDPSGPNEWRGHNVVKWDTPTGAQYTDIFDGAAGTIPTGGDKNAGGVGLTSDGGSEWLMQWFGNSGGSNNYGWAISQRAYGTRSQDLTTPPNPRSPNVDVSQAQAYGAFNWGIIYADQTTGDNIQQAFHKFPCSKCHTPHASRLKRLLRTNCLDNGSASINDNETVDDYKHDYGTNTINGNHTPNPSNAYTTLVENKNLTNFEAANCHSVGGSNSGGWNRITPW
jgi:hypothetical protein